MTSPTPSKAAGAVLLAAARLLSPAAPGFAEAQVVVAPRPRQRVVGPAPHRTVRHHRTVVVAPVRPVPAMRPWYWGRVVAGVTVGAIVTVAAVNSVPRAPSPELC